MAAAQGFAGQLGMDASSSTVTELYEFMSESVRLVEEFHYPSGIVGSRSYPGERVRQGVSRVSGSITMQPNSVELDALLPRILGANESTDVFALASTVPAFYLVIDRVTKVFTYTGCKVARATFRATQGGALELVLDIEGLSESVGNSGTFPSLTLNTAVGPYMAFDISAMTIGGSTVLFREIEIVIDNMLETDRFLQSQTRVSLPEQDRMVTVTLSAPYGDSSAFYALSASGVAVVATFTNGNRSLSFSMAKVHFPRVSPVIEGKSEIFLPLSGRASKSGSTLELVVTNDSSP